TKDEIVQKFRSKDAGGQSEPIRSRLEVWRLTALESLRAATPTMPAGLRDRAEDVLEPLLAIADLAGEGWPNRARAAAVAVMGETPADQDINIALLHDIYLVFKEEDTPTTQITFLASKDLVSKLTAMDSRPWGDWRQGKPISTRAVADRLKGF